MNRPLVSSVAGTWPAHGVAERARRNAGPAVRFAVDRAGMVEALASDALSAGAVSRPPRRIRSVFFDTAARDLGKKKIVLRGYELHGARFLELSWTRARSGGERQSIELRVPGPDFGADILSSSPELRRSIGGQTLAARCVAETERRERLLHLADGCISVVFDDGFVECSGERISFHEIELRLSSGSPALLSSFAAELARLLPLRRLPLGETEIALARMAGRDIATVKAQDPTLEADASLDDAIVAIIGSCLDQFEANWPALTHSQDPEESIHQMRVALRRLRAGVSLIRRGVRSEALEAAGARAKAIAATLGEARNLDVFREMLADESFASMEEEPSFYALLDALECRRASAHDAVRRLIASRETTQFVLDLRAALAARDWSAVEGETPESAGLDTSAAHTARDFAVASLDRLHRKAMKKSRKLASLTPEKRHEARIALKKLRYAAEFFETLFDERREARKYQRRCASVQDSLGASNDLAMAERLLREIDDGLAKGAWPASSFVAGWYAHAQDAESSDWKRAEKCLGKLKPFWR